MFCWLCRQGEEGKVDTSFSSPRSAGARHGRRVSPLKSSGHKNILAATWRRHLNEHAGVVDGQGQAKFMRPDKLKYLVGFRSAAIREPR